MRIVFTILIALLIAAGCSSCRMIDTSTGNSKAGTVDALVPDVPPIAGATKTDLALPLGARMMIRAALQPTTPGKTQSNPATKEVCLVT